MKIDRIENLMIENDGQALQSSRPSTIQTGLSAGEVVVKVCHASLVFKDKIALANAGFVRKFPVFPGNFLTGSVIKSANSAYKAGDRVVQTGWDLDEHHGCGYGRYACLRSDWGVGSFYADEPLPLST